MRQFSAQVRPLIHGRLPALCANAPCAWRLSLSRNLRKRSQRFGANGITGILNFVLGLAGSQEVWSNNVKSAIELEKSQLLHPRLRPDSATASAKVCDRVHSIITLEPLHGWRMVILFQTKKRNC